MLHTIATVPTIVAVPADEDGRGNIAGFRVTCPACGFTFGSSLRGIAEGDAREHVAYMAAKEARKVRFVEDTEGEDGRGRPFAIPAGTTGAIVKTVNASAVLVKVLGRQTVAWLDELEAAR